MAHIFISYSTQNAQYAFGVAKKLREEGFDVWIDDSKLRSGDNWWEVIVRALRGCSAFLVIMTPESKNSRWVQREVTLADNWQKPTFPVLLAGDNWEIFVLTQFEDVRRPDAQPPNYSGVLPSREFYDRIAEVASRNQQRTGDDLVERARTERVEFIKMVDDDDEIRKAIAEPPTFETQPNALPIAEATKTRPPAAAETRPSAPPKAEGPSMGRLAVVGVVALLAIVGLVLMLSQSSQAAEQAEQTRVAFGLTNTAIQSGDSTTPAAPTDTLEPSLTPSATQTSTPTITPSRTPTLSETDFANLVETEVANIALTEAATRDSEVTAVAFQTAERLTETATLWTETPTPNVRQTAVARLTQTATAAIALATRDQRDAIGTATAEGYVTATVFAEELAITATLLTTTPVAAADLTNTAPPFIARADTAVTLRDGPDRSFDGVGTLQTGQEVRVLGRSTTQWLYVEYAENQFAWVSSSFLTYDFDQAHLPLISAGQEGTLTAPDTGSDGDDDENEGEDG
jgi:hypothetical protein